VDSTLILALFFSSLIGYGIVVLLYFSNLKALLRQLEKNHHGQWETLNEPALTAAGLPAQSTGKLFLFLIRKEYSKANDQDLTRAGDKTRRYLTAGLGLFGLLMLSAFLLPLV
jgi:hypothetical protein